MRVLFISNLYPPHALGGWEQNCQEIVQRFRARGHICHVLTSCYGVGNQPLQEDGITRALYLEADLQHYQPLTFFVRRFWQERANRRALRQLLLRFRPDIVFVWGMWNLSTQIAHWAERWLPGRVAYAVADYWPMQPNAHEAYWQRTSSHAWVRALMAPARWWALRLLARERAAYPLMLEQVSCVSHYVRQKLTTAGALPRGARVIYNGVDPQPFCQAASPGSLNEDGLRLVYTGGLVRHKGVRTAVEALGVLKEQKAVDGIRLTLVGAGPKDYETLLYQRAKELAVGDHLVFRGRVPRAEIPSILADHDVFLFTSIYEEPIARSVMEAMAGGLTVIGTAVGGQREMLEDGVNALVVPPDDPAALAERIARLRGDGALRVRLAESGQATVLERFTLERMVDEMEAWLKGMVR